MVEVIEIDKLQCSWILYKYHAVIHKFSGTYKQLSTSHGKNQTYTIVKQWIEEKKQWYNFLHDDCESSHEVYCVVKYELPPLCWFLNTFTVINFYDYPVLYERLLNF